MYAVYQNKRTAVINVYAGVFLQLPRTNNRIGLMDLVLQSLHLQRNQEVDNWLNSCFDEVVRELGGYMAVVQRCVVARYVHATEYPHDFHRHNLLVLYDVLYSVFSLHFQILKLRKY
jgi:hypothetical protein